MKMALETWRSDGFELAYKIRPGGEQGLLFLHGLGCSKETFDSAFVPGVFPQSVSLVAVDLCGHGQSTAPDGYSYALEHQADLLGQFAAHLELPRIAVAAHSMSGIIALLLLPRLANGEAIFCLEGNLSQADCTLSRRITAVDESKFAQYYPLLKTEPAAGTPPADPMGYYRTARSTIEWTAGDSLIERYRSLKAARTYLVGEQNTDGETPTALRRLGEVVVEIGGSGHFMMLDNPAATYAAIRDELDAMRESANS